MATSSIYTNIKITEKSKAEEFVNALERAFNDSLKRPIEKILVSNSEKEKLSAFMGKTKK